ncbi:MAG: glycosyltransferase [Alloprevotella sp.]
MQPTLANTHILLIIPETTGTIASVSYNLYKGLLAETEGKVYVVSLAAPSPYGFPFKNLFSIGEATGLKRLFYRRRELSRLKRRLHIDISISTLLGASYWNVLSDIGDFKIGLFHTTLKQQKFTSHLLYYAHLILHYLCLRSLDRLVAVNQSALLDLQHLFGSRRDIRLAYNIHDIALIRQRAQEPLESEEEFTIFSHKVILYVGHIFPIKGPHRLIEAYARMKDRENTCLVLLGEDSAQMQKSLSEKAVRLGIREQVFFLGHKDNPYKYMQRAAMLVSPSLDEGLPGVLIEALSLGLKCVATNSSRGIWEIMECAEAYQPNLHEIYVTRYGIISPNKLSDEHFTIRCLTHAMEICYDKDYLDMELFDVERFTSKTVIPQFLGDYTPTYHREGQTSPSPSNPEKL